VGFFRSGTSLLYSVLNQHPQVALMYECNVLDFPEIFRRAVSRQLARTTGIFSHSLSRHRLILKGSLRGLENVKTPLDLYRTFSQSKVPRFAGKSRRCTARGCGSWLNSSPTPRFILIWRDPVEIYRSVAQAARTVAFLPWQGLVVGPDFPAGRNDPATLSI